MSETTTPDFTHASPRPWTYHTAPSAHGYGNRDWIEDATGNTVLQHVRHIDGPLICAAVNAFTPPSATAGERENDPEVPA